MIHRILPLLALAALVATPTPVTAQEAPGQSAPNPAEASLRATLERGLAAFNQGDFKGYLADFAPKVAYNELTIDRSRLVDINQDLKQVFPNLQMRYQKIRLRAELADEAWATTVAEFTGDTRDYEGSGYPATYREQGQVSALYKRRGGEWITDQIQVAWNDSTIDIGQPFGALGYTTLPTLTGTGQPYRFRLHVGHNYMAQEAVTYAYTVAPMSAVIDKAGSEAVFSALKYAAVPPKGVDVEMRAPQKGGTYVHLLVLTKLQRTQYGEQMTGQKVYTRLVRVED
jgi:hypothetical protein